MTYVSSFVTRRAYEKISITIVLTNIDRLSLLSHGCNKWNEQRWVRCSFPNPNDALHVFTQLDVAVFRMSLMTKLIYRLFRSFHTLVVFTNFKRFEKIILVKYFKELPPANITILEITAIFWQNWSNQFRIFFYCSIFFRISFFP